MRYRGLKPDTFYRYEIKASDGALESRVSGSRIVHTLESSGIGEIPAAGISVAVDGDAVVVDNRSDRPMTMAVYTVSGLVCGRMDIPAGETLRWTLPGHGAYIVRLDGKAFKIMY